MSSIARRYAKALFEIGEETDTLDALAGELDDIAAALKESDELANLLGSPVASARLRKEVFAGIAEKLGTGEIVGNLVRLLIDRNRMGVYPDLARVFRMLVDEARGQLRGELLSARPLTETQIEAIKTKLGNLTGKEVVLEVHERPELIGGIVARVGNTVFDGSVAKRLESLERSMTQGGA